MKYTLLMLSLVLISFGAKAQDIIEVKSGNRIEAKVLEISPDNVKYKKYNNIDGPLYTVNKNDIKEIIFENGDVEVFVANGDEMDTRKAIFIKTTEDSQSDPSQELWKDEIERHPSLKNVRKVEDADLIFEFRIRRALGEARVSVKVYDANNKELWESKRYRGTTNAFNRMSPTLDALRKSIDKGIMREMEKGTF